MEESLARVPAVPIDRLPPDLQQIYAAFSGTYGNFGNQVQVLAHSASGLRHIGGLMMEWREQANLPRRLVEVAVVTVSRLNRCPYCIAHHGPVLLDMGITPEAVDGILEPVPPGFEPLDVLVRDYARLVIERPWGIRDRVFEDLRGAFTDAQIVELTLRISLCNLFNQLNEAMQIAPEDGVVEEASARGLGPALAEAQHP
jgi:AhpD family alkylhydroperoxidase